MDDTQAIPLFAALAHAQRLAAFRLLMRCGSAGLAAGELAQQLAISPSALSFHLKEMENAGLVRQRRVGRSIIYRADLTIGQTLGDFLQRDCCLGLDGRAAIGVATFKFEGMSTMLKPPFRLLVLCTGNSARSILGEQLLTELGQGRFIGLSAGSKPKGTPHPLALETLIAHGHAIEGLSSKSWDEFAVPGAPAIDIVLTVCDAAAGEVCPVWPGHPISAHWGLDDPAAVDGSVADKRAAFETTYQLLRRRIAALIRLPLETMQAPAIRQALQTIHQEALAADMIAERV